MADAGPVEKKKRLYGNSFLGKENPLLRKRRGGVS